MHRLYKRYGIASALGLVILAVTFFLPVADGAEYPAKTIQIINPFPPGATTDLIARLLTDKLSSLLGQAVVVVNKTGGGGAVGIRAVKDAPADGYTVLVVPPPFALIPLARKGIGYAVSDFTPINFTGNNPAVMVVKSDAPWQTLEQFVADAKKNPGKFTFGTPGTGTSGHFGLELFKMETGTDLIHVPMGGEAPVAAAILGGNIHTSIIALGTVRAHLEAGTLRALAVTAKKRSRAFPDIPTVVEKGYPSIDVSPWFIFLVRANTPPAIVDKLAKAFKEVVGDKDIAAKIEKAGVTVENGGPDEAAKFLAQEHKKWSEVARVAKIGQ
ncbi:MAG: tripartite tricarboxylate transporter substrate binding protein [Deltaproteobacteria bacterium]|nr:tripartite tricarboxylate transporter substrate binding protein [Deltaproteobacteria bacterium]